MNRAGESEREKGVVTGKGERGRTLKEEDKEMQTAGREGGGTKQKRTEGR